MVRVSWILSAGLVLLGSAQAFCGEVVDQIVATVDSEIILYSDLLDEAAPLLSDLQAKATSQEAYASEKAEVIEEALDTAIERRILYREAQLAGIQVTDKDVEERLNKIIAGYDSQEQFRQALEEAGETMGDLRENLRKQIMAISFGMQKHKAFEEEVVISEAEMQQYYQDNSAEFSEAERVKLRRIFLGAPSDPAERAKVKARLEALAEEARQGADFAALAKQHSEGPDAADSGLMGWVAKGDLVPELEAAAFSLPAGGISEVIETQWGFHLLRVDEKNESGVSTYESSRTQIEPALRAKYADERYEKWIAELRKRSRVRVFI